MERNEERVRAVLQAASCLPPRLYHAVSHTEDENLSECEEVHLRSGQPPTIGAAGRERRLHAEPVTIEELRETFGRAAGYSVHRFAENLQFGFIPIVGGHRLGICGSVSVRDGHITGFRTISSLNLRVAMQQKGTADAVLENILRDGSVRNTLLLSPPGLGKTTLLRDLIRQLSERGLRVGVADERGELAALTDGMPQFDLGPCCDILDGSPKAEGVLMLLKTMSPQVVAMDEITSPADVEAVNYAAHCGVSVLATAHAYDEKDLRFRPLYQKMMEARLFERLVLISFVSGKRHYVVHNIGGRSNA